MPVGKAGQNRDKPGSDRANKVEQGSEGRHVSQGLALIAALAFALALLLWWIVVYPVNVQLATWVNGPVPDDWTRWRGRWEWGHAAIALIELVGFAALVWSVLEDGPVMEPVVKAVTAVRKPAPARTKPKRRPPARRT